MPSPDFDPLVARALPWAGAAAFAALLSLGTATGAQAQTATDAQYDRQVAACANNTALPAPERAACIRAVGSEQDRLRAAQAFSAGSNRPPTETPLPSGQSSDGRATLVQQSGTRMQAEPATSSPEVRTSTDGRATLVVPTGSTNRPAGTP